MSGAPQQIACSARYDFFVPVNVYKIDDGCGVNKSFGIYNKYWFKENDTVFYVEIKSNKIWEVESDIIKLFEQTNSWYDAFTGVLL